MLMKELPGRIYCRSETKPVRRSDNVTDNEQAILTALESEDQAADIARASGLSESGTHSILRRLMDRGLVKRTYVDKSQRDRGIRWRLA